MTGLWGSVGMKHLEKGDFHREHCDQSRDFGDSPQVFRHTHTHTFFEDGI